MKTHKTDINYKVYEGFYPIDINALTNTIGDALTERHLSIEKIPEMLVLLKWAESHKVLRSEDVRNALTEYGIAGDKVVVKRYPTTEDGKNTRFDMSVQGEWNLLNLVTAAVAIADLEHADMYYSTMGLINLVLHTTQHLPPKAAVDLQAVNRTSDNTRQVYETAVTFLLQEHAPYTTSTLTVSTHNTGEPTTHLAATIVDAERLLPLHIDVTHTENYVHCIVSTNTRSRFGKTDTTPNMIYFNITASIERQADTEEVGSEITLITNSPQNA